MGVVCQEKNHFGYPGLIYPCGDGIFEKRRTCMDILKIALGLVIGGVVGFGLSYLSRGIGSA